MISPAVWQQLADVLAPRELSTDPQVCLAHAGDKWFASATPEAVALPNSTESVVRILKFATTHQIPVTPRGAGHGYVGGCVPVRNGLVLSLASMNRILEISESDFLAVVQPGVLTAELQAVVEKVGRFYPPDPASRADCSLGGNVATNAGGPRCLKYGVTRDYVLGLEAVLMDGTRVRLGGRTHKNKTGFDIHRLLVGSEGMLAVVTEITLKLLPLPPYRACLGVGFSDIPTAIEALQAILAQGFSPSALELADAFTLAAARKRTGSRRLSGCGAHLIVELDGREKNVRNDLRELRRLMESFNPIFVDRGFGPEGCEKLWRLRREFSYALRDTGLTKLNEDVVVPRGRLAALFDLAAGLQSQYGIQVACFGHAGDGNIHVNLMVDTTNPDQRVKSEEALDALFQGVLALGGSITGEHGVGLAKQRWWQAAVGPETDELHRTLKRAFDPHGLLNPGKFVRE
jgi:glycolate oxidase subunit GlcD